MKKFIFYGVTAWLILWTQVFINHFLGGSWVSINLVLDSVLYFGLIRGPLTGQFLGLVWGLLIDASSLGLMGMHMLLYAVGGYTAGMLRRQLDADKPWTQAIFCLTVSIFYLLFYFIIDRLLSGADQPIDWKIATQPFFNAVAAPMIFWAMGRWEEAWHMTVEERPTW